MPRNFAVVVVSSTFDYRNVETAQSTHPETAATTIVLPASLKVEKM